MLEVYKPFGHPITQKDGMTTQPWEDFFQAVPVIGHDVRNFDSFSDAINAVDSGVILVSNGTFAAGGVTVPYGVELWFFDGGKLSVATGETCTINGTVRAGPYQIFDIAGTGVVNVNGGQPICVNWYCDDGTGTAADPWTGPQNMGGLGEAIASCGNDKKYFMIAGYYEPTTTVAIDQDDIEIEGAGRGATYIVYQATDDSVCLDINKGLTASEEHLISFLKVGGFSLIGYDPSVGPGTPVADGIGIRIYQGQNITLHDIYLRGWNADYTTNVGIQIACRDLINLKRVKMYTVATCLQFINDQSHATIDADQVHIEDCAWTSVGDTSATTDCKIIDLNGQSVHRMSMSGKNNWAGAYYGIYYSGSGPGANTFLGQFSFQTEGMNTSGWDVYIDVNSGNYFHGISFVNGGCASECNGMYFDGVLDVLLDNWYLNQDAKVPFQSESDVFPIVFRNVEVDARTNMNIGAQLVFEIYSSFSSDNSYTLGVWDDPTTNTYSKFGTYSSHTTSSPSLASTTYTIDRRDGDIAFINRQTTGAFTVNDNNTGSADQMFTLCILNNSGGTITCTWDSAFVFSDGVDPTMPVDGKYLTLTFWVRTTGIFTEVGRKYRSYSSGETLTFDSGSVLRINSKIDISGNVDVQSNSSDELTLVPASGGSTDVTVAISGGGKLKSARFQPQTNYHSTDGTGGLTDTFTNGDGDTVTVKNGLITAITAP